MRSSVPVGPAVGKPGERLPVIPSPVRGMMGCAVLRPTGSIT